MLIGLLLIGFGLLIAFCPQILVAMVATTLICMGVGICVMSVQWQRMRRGSRFSFHSWMTRF